MIFYIHGLHKLEGWIADLQHGTPWTLAEEVVAMHTPAPLASAVAATLVQFICSLFIVVGLFTRIYAALLVLGALSGAILPQNLLAGRDPQLAILYTLVVITFFIFEFCGWIIFTRCEIDFKGQRAITRENLT